MSSPRIHRVIMGVHMGLGHDGLKRLLAKPLAKGGANFDVEDLQDGDLLMCINAVGDKMKVIGCTGLVIGYLKLPNKKRIMLDALQFIPQTFGGSGFNYDAAVKVALAERMAMYPRKKIGPLENERARQKSGV